MSFRVWDVDSTWRWCLRANPEEGTREGAPPRNPWGKPSGKHWTGLGTQEQGERHAEREVRHQIWAMLEETWGAVGVWSEDTCPHPDLFGIGGVRDPGEEDWHVSWDGWAWTSCKAREQSRCKDIDCLELTAHSARGSGPWWLARVTCNRGSGVVLGRDKRAWEATEEF